MMKLTFEQKFEHAKETSPHTFFGFELKDKNGDLKYGDITYDSKTNKMHCLGVEIEADNDFSVDQNIESLYEALMKAGYSDFDVNEDIEDGWMMVEFVCCKCNRKKFVKVRKEDYILWNSDESPLVYECFPYLSPDERELFLTKICGECFDKMFPEDDEEIEEDDAD